MIIHSPLCKDRRERSVVKTYVSLADHEFFLMIKECPNCGRKQHESASVAQFHRTVFLLFCNANHYPYGILDLFLSGSGYTRNDLAWALGVTYSSVEKWARNLRKKFPRYLFLTLQMMIEGYERGPDIDNLTPVVKGLQRKYKDTWRSLAAAMGCTVTVLWKICQGQSVGPSMMPFFSYYRMYPEAMRARLFAQPNPLKKQEYIIG